MIRLNLLVLAALLASAGYLVRTSYESRRLFTALERERIAARELESEADRLEVARREQATSLRIERVAREQLGMRSASTRLTYYLSDDTAPPAGGQP